ncbi:phosphatase PAP2 family protein [Bacteroidales bacterium OttesenSCG-928-L03]|nr:phosphatase PAP2 family protein [Bacteroidales bacterium OttesenSCG-928-L03]
MLEGILDYERDAFFFINGNHSYFMDCTMWLFSKTKMWILFYGFLLFALVFKKKPHEWIPIVVGVALLVLCCDQFSSAVCKPLFTRFRPSKHPEFMDQVRTIYGYLGGGKYGFISGHATNSFGIAVFASLFMKRKFFTIVLCLWAAIVAVSRVYLGVHFISDIVAGAIVGSLIAWGLYSLYRIYEKKMSRRKRFTHYTAPWANLSAGVLLGYMVLITALSIPIMSILK